MNFLQEYDMILNNKQEICSEIQPHVFIIGNSGARIIYAWNKPHTTAESAAQEVTGMKMKMNMNMNIDVSEWTKRKIVRYIMTFMGAAAIAISIFG